MVLCFDSKKIYGIYWTYRGVVISNFMTIGCVWTARLYFTNGVYAAGIEQWTVRDMPNFKDLILKLGWMFWAII